MLKENYQIRLATVADVESIRRMQAQSWRETYQNDELGVTTEWLKKHTDAWFTPERLAESKSYLSSIFINNRDNFYRVATKDGQIVGMIHVDAGIADNRKRLCALYVAKPEHGRGLAQQLMALANQWLGKATVELEVVSYNERAKAFYRKNGFREVPGSELLHAEKIPSIKMIREAK